MSTTADCPTNDRLRSLLDGQLPDAEQAELQQHIDSCERCQQALESLVAGKESWDGIVRRLGDGETPVTPALQDAITAAKEMEATSPCVKLPPGILQPSEQPDSMGRLAHYEVLHEVGSGGMGIVLKAFDTSLRRVVAIKVMAPHLAANAAARRRFVREAQAAAAVAHDHVVAIHAVAGQHEPPYLAMQFIEGKTLQERLDESGPLSVREVLRIGMQTAAGLAAAHAQGLVHRDIKPANILLENGVERVKLTDFGLARAVDDASVTQSGVIAGTPLFMSPEQARGEVVDHRSDLFSLGSVMYAMCVGHSPFRASTTMGVIKRVCDDSPRPIREVNPDVPDWLNDIIAKLLGKAPGDRFQTAAEVADLLGQFLAHVQQPSVVARPSGVAALVEKASVESTNAASSSTERVPFLFSPMSALPVHPMFGAIFWFGLTMLVISLGLAGLNQLNVFSASVAAPLSGPFMFLVGIGSVLLVLMVVVQAISNRDWRATSLGPRPVLSAVALGVLIVIEMLMFATWGGNESAAQPRDPAMEFTRAIPAGTLLVIAAGLLLTGVVVGIRRFVRGLDTKTPGGRLWGTALTGALLAAASGSLLLVASFVSVYWLSHVEPKIATAHLTFKVAGPHVEVTLNGEKIAVPVNDQVDLQLLAGEYVITTIKNGHPVVRSGEVLHGGELKIVDELQADAIQISGPLVMAYGPGSSAPNVNDYIAIQGRWVIVSQEKNGIAVTELQRGQWIEFDRGYMRSDVPDTPRSLAFLAESLVALYANETPSQIDVLNIGAKGIYRLDRETLTLAIADAGQPRPNDFVSRPGSTVTLTVLKRAESDDQRLQGRWRVVSQEAQGQAIAAPFGAEWVEFSGGLFRTKLSDTETITERRFKLNPSSTPQQIDLFGTQDRAHEGTGIYRLDGETLTLCIGSHQQNRATEFSSGSAPGLVLTVLKRESDHVPPVAAEEDKKIAWGEASPKGVQLGLKFEPSKTIYQIGGVVKARLYLRNTGNKVISTTLPRLEVLEKFGFDLLLLDEQDKPLTWTWGKAHKSRELFTVSGGMELPLRPGAIHELPAAEIVIGKEASSPTTMAVLDVEPGQTCRLVCKLGTYGYAKGEGEPLESGIVQFRVEAANGGSPKSAAIIKELRELIAQHEQDLDGVRKRHAVGIAPEAEVRQVEMALAEVQIRMANVWRLRS